MPSDSTPPLRNVITPLTASIPRSYPRTSIRFPSRAILPSMAVDPSSPSGSETPKSIVLLPCGARSSSTLANLFRNGLPER